MHCTGTVLRIITDVINNMFVTPNAIALDLLSSSDCNYDGKNCTPYSVNNNIALFITKIQLI